MVLVSPNKSIVKGKIRSMTRNSKFKVQLEVIDSKDVEGVSNFTRRHIGSTITVLYSNKDGPKLRNEDIIESYIEYFGDEAGGMFHGQIKQN